MSMSAGDLGYIAALIDVLAVLKVRQTHGNDLPVIALTTSRSQDAVMFLANRSGSRVTTIARAYQRKGCVDHCQIAHQHIESTGYRWQVTGTRATVILHNLVPYLRVQREMAEQLVTIGKSIGYSTSVAQEMCDLGWELPVLKMQPRARKKIEG
jgi:hypothetical protein